jgi:phosphinothricin acetyltransferase
MLVVDGLTAPVQLRAVTFDDVAAIHALYTYHVEHGLASWELEPPSAAEMDRRVQAILGAGYPYLVATVADELVGYAYASSYRPRAGYRYTVEDSIYLHPRVAGRGIGRFLLGELIRAATERGYRQMIAVIGDSRNLASIRLHAALGFTHIGTFPNVGWKHGQWLDSVMMQLSLGAGATIPPDL